MLVGASSNSGARQNVRWCVVPNVKGARLNTAVKRLRAAHCAVGRVTGPRTAFVGAESPKPNQRRKRGAKVALTLKRRPGSQGTTTTPSTATTTVTGTTPVTGTTSTPAPPAGDPLGISGSWHLVIDSNFNGSSLPPDWRVGWGGSGVTGPVNSSEIACYGPNNVTLPGDGTVHLAITAQQSTCKGNTEPYTAALLNTNPDDGRTGPGFQYTYGVLEARMYLPPAANERIADWPAFWANGQNWPTTGEDDVIEGLQGCAFWSFHNAAGLTNDCIGAIGPGWHIFASDWQPGSITYYYDGVQVGQVNAGITSSPIYIVLANSVPSDAPDVRLGPDSMQVQYVRVFQH